ncbi:hypothetical protein [Kineosporia sp. NBRC 101677]|uniref:hypothetical protein n=1 Tax=Kineosporia sp. NBRC 101677 TaxID=3032197 RepID=UPI002555D6C1|nr:hypothetical protein [Kineosporia sp. NBRC 101677]
MPVDVFAGRILEALPRSPGQAWAKLRHAVEVLGQEPRMLLACVLLILAGLAVAFTRSRAPSVSAGLGLVLSSVIWLRVSQPREGTVLVLLAPTRGITEADLLVPLVIGLALAVRAVRRYTPGAGSARVFLP